MSNTTYNKVVVNNETIIDLSSDTVTDTAHIVTGYIGHLANGTRVTGSGGSGVVSVKYENNDTGRQCRITGGVVTALSVTDNGIYAPSAGTNVVGYSPVTVNVSSGGAAEHVIEPTLNGPFYEFDLTTENLTAADVVLDAHTTIYIETTSNITCSVWLDSNDDDDFSVTIPSGTRMTCAMQSGSILYFPFVFGSNATYGFLTFNVNSYYDSVSAATYPSTPGTGGLTRSSGYGQTNGIPSIEDCSDMELHILKY